jgi:predicted O-linked N-acetylglucosamine transferase (SPINDLY family)
MNAESDKATSVGKSRLQEALALHQLGDLTGAENAYRGILRTFPRDFDATYLLGLVCLQKGAFTEAESQFRRAITINPKAANALNDHGSALLEIDKPAEALVQYDKAIALDPTMADAFNNRGNALIRLRRFDEAVGSFDQAIALNPAHALAYCNRGNALRQLGRHEEALASYQAAIALRSDYAEAYNNSGNALSELKRCKAALAAYEKAIAIRPFFVEAHCNRADALIDLRHYNDALAAADRAVALNPEFANAWRARADCLQNLARNDESLIAYERALKLSPDLVDAWSGKGNALHRLKRHADAASSFVSLLKIRPEYPFAKGMLLHQKLMTCEWSGIAELINEIERDIDLGRLSAEPFGWQAVSSSPRSLLRCAEIFNVAKFPVDFNAAPARPPEHRKIRIGYLGDVFREQAVSFLLVGALELADKSRFELYGFDNGVNDKSETRKRVEASLTEMVDITSRDDASIAALIRQREIDILVNLNVYFGDHRTGVFAKRPAPIQANYLGFPATLGASYSDYIIADRWVIPPDDRDFYSEKVVYLPECYQANDRKKAISPREFSRAECGLPENGFVFCCFNNNFKITPGMLERWMRILRKTADSVLWLLDDNPSAGVNLRAEAKARGIDPDRLIFAKRMHLTEHLARHRLADLFLDTLPYNAHTTASDALWAGLPVLTQVGSTFPGRVGASLLNAVGLPELITSTPQTYEDLAVELAANPEKLTTIKRKLANNRLTMPLFDTALYARRLDAAYAAMYERYRAGLSPDHIEL